MRRDHGSLASSVLLISLAACSGGSGDPDAAGLLDSGGGTPDATQNPDAPAAVDANLPDAYIAALDCLGDPLPETADDNVTIAGDVFDPGIPGLIPETLLSGVNLASFARGDETTTLDTDVSAATTGAFSLTAATGGDPLDAYIRAQQSGNPSHITTYVYPGAPQTTSQTGIRIPMFSESTFDLIQNFSGISQEDDQGLVTVIVVDCNGDPLANATVTSNPPAATTAYLENDAPSTTVGHTDATGLAFLVNVAIPDAEISVEAEISATYDSMNLRAHTVTVPEFTASANESKMVTTQVVP